MNTILLTRKSVFQVYCANKLFASSVITHVIFEEERLPTNRIILLKKQLFKVFKYLGNPTNLFFRMLYYLNYEKYYGNQSFHNKRVLNIDDDKVSSELKVFEVESMNGSDTMKIICDIKPDLVYVFGTKMISKDVIDKINCPMINMHWGWSPTYRGEGIVPALAKEGAKGLGVTVHYIDAKSDSGDIIQQSRIEIDKCDNLYSIGLKMAKKGTELFIIIFQQFKKHYIKSTKQDLTQGKLYGSLYLRSNSQVYLKAWHALEKEKIKLGAKR